MKKSGFTLIELLVSMTIFVLAISVALFATVGSNSMLSKADSRAAIVEGSRTVTDTLRRMVTDTKYAQITIAQVSSVNVGVLAKIYNQDLGQNICQVVGRADETVAASGATSYTLSNTGGYLATWIFKLNDSGVCETTNMQSYMLFQNRLMDANVRVSDFKISKNDIKAGSLAMLRYRIKLQVADATGGGTTEAKQASIDVVSSISIGLN